MYTFKVFKNGQEIHPIHSDSAGDTVTAYAIWESMQMHYEKRCKIHGYSYYISMLKYGQEIHNVDYEY